MCVLATLTEMKLLALGTISCWSFFKTTLIEMKLLVLDAGCHWGSSHSDCDEIACFRRMMVIGVQGQSD
jgi:hypothetical protein